MTNFLIKPTKDQFSTLGELLRLRADAEPEKKIYTFLVDGNMKAIHYALGELELQEQLTVGERALLLYPPGLKYIAAFLGCQVAGIVAVPVFPPDPTRLSRTLPRLKSILNDAKPAVILTPSGIYLLAQQLFTEIPDLQVIPWITTDSISEELAVHWKNPVIGIL